MWGRGRQRDDGPPACDIADECELFLLGRYVEHHRTLHRPVPAWVRLNVLAHATTDELAATRPATGLDAESEWATVTAHLAREILDVVGGDPDRLRDLQLRALVPLELRLAIRSQIVLRPAQLVQLVTHELERCR